MRNLSPIMLPGGKPTHFARPDADLVVHRRHGNPGMRSPLCLARENIMLASEDPGQLDLGALPAPGSLPATQRPGLPALSPGRGPLRRTRARLGRALRTRARVL